MNTTIQSDFFIIVDLLYILGVIEDFTSYSKALDGVIDIATKYRYYHETESQ